MSIAKFNGNMPASPSTEYELGSDELRPVTYYPGLSKREQFAMAAMQGLLAASYPRAYVTEAAVSFADGLLAELEKELNQ